MTDIGGPGRNPMTELSGSGDLEVRKEEGVKKLGSGCRELVFYRG